MDGPGKGCSTHEHQLREGGGGGGVTQMYGD